MAFQSTSTASYKLADNVNLKPTPVAVRCKAEFCNHSCFRIPPKKWKVDLFYCCVLCRRRGEWRKLHNEELRDLYSLPNIVRVVKSRRVRWAGHVARMGGGVRCAQDSSGET